MAYDPTTNESDLIFSQQLDSMKLSGSAIDPVNSSLSSNVYQANLGLRQELGLDMDSRIKMHGASMSTRAAIASDRTKIREAEQVNEALAGLKKSTIPGDGAGNASAYQDAIYSAPGNEKLAGIVTRLRDADKFQHQAKKEASEQDEAEMAMRIDEQTRMAREQDTLARIESNLEASKAERDRASRMRALEGVQREDEQLSLAGDVGSLDLETGRASAKVFQFMRESDMDDAVIGKFESTLSTLLQVSKVSDSAAIQKESYMPEINSMSKYMDLANTPDDVAIEKSLKLWRTSKNQNGGYTAIQEQNRRLEIETALAKYRTHEGAGNLLQQTKGLITELSSKDFSTMGPEEIREFKGDLAALSVDMHIINGKRERLESSYSSETSRRKAAFDLYKEGTELKIKVEEFALDKQAQVMRDYIERKKLQGAHVDDLLSFYRTLTKTQKEALVEPALKEYGKINGIEDPQMSDVADVSALFRLMFDKESSSAVGPNGGVDVWAKPR